MAATCQAGSNSNLRSRGHWRRGQNCCFLDKPTEGIQPSIIKDISRVIRMLACRDDMAIALVEQYNDFAAELADDYLVMERGEVITRGSDKDMETNGVRRLVAI